MTCNFRVGQKVVCVDSRPRVTNGVLFGLEEGAVYTIAATSIVSGVDETVIFLAETANIDTNMDSDEDWGYLASRFRPAVERGTEKGMSILRNLLNKTDKPVEVDA